MATSLSEEHRLKLDSIVSQMEANGETPDDIQFVVNDFKTKYRGSSTGDMKEKVSSYLRPALEIGGGVGGGLLASPLGPVAAVGGGALGYGAGKSAADLADRLMGIKKDISFKDVPGEVAGNLMEGAEQEAGGLVLGRGLKALKAIEKSVRSTGKDVGQAAISTVSPASLEAVKARFANPEAVRNAMTREQLGNAVVSSANTLSQQIRALDDAAKKTLSGELSIPKEDLISGLNALKKRYVGASEQAVSGEAKAAIAELENTISGIGRVNPLPDIPASVRQVGEEVIPGVLPRKVPVMENVPAKTGRTASSVSEEQLKDVMSQYKGIQWNDPAGSAKKDVRKLLDATLKKNTEYKKAMMPVAERTKLQSIIEKKLGLKYDPTGGTYATDATAGKWTPALLEGKKPETSQALKRLGKLTDTDLLEKAKMTNYREQFEGVKTQGSRMVQLGRHVAGVPGAVLGAAMDRMGGNVSGKLIDVLASLPSIPNLTPEASQEMVRLLSAALQSRRPKANAR